MKTNETETGYHRLAAVFDAIIAEQQEIQKRNPFGSPEHKAAYARIRELVRLHKGVDIGDYE